jgi:GTPase SAR1 family protein
VVVAKFGKFYFLKSIINGAQQCAFHGLSSILIFKNTYMRIHIKVHRMASEEPEIDPAISSTGSNDVPQHSPSLNQTRDFLDQQVNAVLMKALTEIQIHKPEDVCQALLNYFEDRQANAAGITVNAGGQYSSLFTSDKGCDMHGTIILWLADLPTKNIKGNSGAVDRWYAVHHVLPILARLLKHFASQWPFPVGEALDTCVVAFLLEHQANQKGKRLPETFEEAGKLLETFEEAGQQLECTTNSDIPDIQGPQPPRLANPYTVLVLGYESSGKSTVLASLQGDPCPTPLPASTLNSVPEPVTITLERLFANSPHTTQLRFLDVPGDSDSREHLWPSLYPEAQAVVWVGDATQAGRWEEEKEILRGCLGSLNLRGKPVWALINKQDTGLPHHSLGRVEEEIRGLTECTEMKKAEYEGSESVKVKEQISSERMTLRVDGCIAEARCNFGVLDPTLEQGLAWLVKAIQGHDGK